MFKAAADRTMRSMRRQLMMIVVTVLVVAGAGCASADVGNGSAGPPTGTTVAPTPEENETPISSAAPRGHGER
jgi:hypothetical protein